MSSSEDEYRATFDAWAAGEPAYALELSRSMLASFPDFTLGRMIQGVILYELARYDEAERLLQAAVKDLSGGNLYYGYVHLGHLHRERGEFADAERWYRKAIEVNPDKSGPHIFLGAMLAKKGDLAGAEASHRLATSCSAGEVDEAFLNLGLVFRAQGRYQEALASFESALTITPDYEEAIRAKGDVQKTIAYLHGV